MAEPAPGAAAVPPPGTPGPADPPPPSAPEPLQQTLRSLWGELRGLVSDRVDLLSLEIERATKALTQIVALVIAAAILGVTAWLVLWAGIVALFIALGMNFAVALFVVLGLNLLAIWLAVGRVRKLLPRLGLPATRRHLTITPSPVPKAADIPASEPARHERPDFTPAGQPAAR